MHNQSKIQKIVLVTLPIILTVSLVSVQGKIGTGEARRLYQRYCAGCHGSDGAGRMGLNLVDGEWK